MQVSRLKKYKNSSFKQDFVIRKPSIVDFSTSSSLLEIIVDLMANSWAAALVQQEAACGKTPHVGHHHIHLWLLKGMQEERKNSLHQAPR